MNLGIDFGSTYTTLSRYVDDTDQLQDIVLHEGVPYIPSVAAEKEGKFQFGSEAKAKTGKKGYTTYKAFKMLLPEVNEERLQARGYSKEHTPTDIADQFLDYCMREALVRCGESRIGKLVVGVPEVWNDRPETVDGRNILRNICAEKPYVDEVQIVSEPAAASAFFASNFQRNTGRNFHGHILLIDYGGGTLDITLTNVTARDEDNVEIAIDCRTGAGENTDREVGKAGILYMESVMEEAILRCEGPDAEVIRDGKFFKAVDQLERELQTSRSTIADIFNEIGIDDIEALEEEEFTTIEYLGEDIPVTFGLLADVYRRVIAPVFSAQLDKMIEYMDREGIAYDDADQEVFKIALVGGFGNYYLVDAQVRERFHFSSMDMRQKDIIRAAMDREKAVSMGAALIASGVIAIHNTAPYSIGFPKRRDDSGKADYAFRLREDIVYGQVYYPHYEKDADRPIVYFVGGVPETFVVNTGMTDETAVTVRLKKEFAARLQELVRCADERYQTALIGFSLDSSGVLSLHVQAYDPVRKTAEGEDHEIVLDSVKNLFDFASADS